MPHEFAHSLPHKDPEAVFDRRIREVQAVSVTYAVSIALGLDISGYFFDYVAS